MKIYLAGRFMNKGRLQELRTELLRWGHTVTSRWLDVDKGNPTDTAQMDLDDIDNAEALVLLFDEVKEGERPMAGAYIEYGYALAQGKRLYIIEEHKPHAHIFFELPAATKLLNVEEFLWLAKRWYENSQR